MTKYAVLIPTMIALMAGFNADEATAQGIHFRSGGVHIDVGHAHHGHRHTVIWTAAIRTERIGTGEGTFMADGAVITIGMTRPTSITIPDRLYLITITTITFRAIMMCITMATGITTFKWQSVID